MPLKIVFTGPESTGKSTAAAALAAALNAPLVTEYAREYPAVAAGKYTAADLPKIAAGQAAREAAARRSAASYYICDTSFLVLKIWYEYKFGNCHPDIRELYLQNQPDLYFLCDIDVPWEYDPLRENPEERAELFDLYEKELQKSGVPYHILRGNPGERLIRARKIIKNLHGK